MNMTKQHIPLPKDTKAFICAHCGVVALSPNDICKVQGKGTKSDWCGTHSCNPPCYCHNKVHTVRYSCAKCGQAAINPELLCEPEKMAEP